MGFKRKLYGKKGKKNSITTSSLSNEIDLRSEFDEIIYGTGGGIPHGKKVIIRKFRVDDDNNLSACSCRDEMTNEGDPDCPYCLGEAYFWDEDWAVTYSMFVGSDGGLTRRNIPFQPGTVRVDSKVFYFRYDTDFAYTDKIVEIKLDTEGDPVVPYIRQAIYKPESIVEYRSDYGRLEYLAVYCRENDAIRLDL